MFNKSLVTLLIYLLSVVITIALFYAAYSAFGIIGIVFLFVYIFIMYALSFMYDTKNNDDEQK